MGEMYEEFLNIADKLNQELDITPLLYGSLGLQRVAGIDFCPDDIDLLIPKVYLEDNWSSIINTVEGLGYELIDPYERLFVRGAFKVAFADIESLEPYAGIDLEGIKISEEEGIKYKVLNLHQYLKVYLQSSKDGYRKTKNNSKDLVKIRVIKDLLSNKL